MPTVPYNKIFNLWITVKRKAVERWEGMQASRKTLPNSNIFHPAYNEDAIDISEIKSRQSRENAISRLYWQQCRIDNPSYIFFCERWGMVATYWLRTCCHALFKVDQQVFEASALSEKWLDAWSIRLGKTEMVFKRGNAVKIRKKDEVCVYHVDWLISWRNFSTGQPRKVQLPKGIVWILSRSELKIWVTGLEFTYWSFVKFD